MPHTIFLTMNNWIVAESAIAGVVLIVLFGIGHRLPIVVAGSSAAMVKGVLEDSRWQGAAQWFRKGAVVAICLIALYSITNPFLSAQGS
jgi:cytochrome c-type biogenesis protein